MTQDGTWSDESDWETFDSDSADVEEPGPAPVVAIPANLFRCQQRSVENRTHDIWREHLNEGVDLRA